MAHFSHLPPLFPPSPSPLPCPSRKQRDHRLTRRRCLRQRKNGLAPTPGRGQGQRTIQPRISCLAPGNDGGSGRSSGRALPRARTVKVCQRQQQCAEGNTAHESLPRREERRDHKGAAQARVGPLARVLARLVHPLLCRCVEERQHRSRAV